MLPNKKVRFFFPSRTRKCRGEFIYLNGCASMIFHFFHFKIKFCFHFHLLHIFLFLFFSFLFFFEKVALKHSLPFELLVSEPGVDAPLANHFRINRISGLWNGNLKNSSNGRFRSRFFRDLCELSVVANESGDDDGDHGHQREEDEESREPGDGKAHPVHDLLAHSTLRN